LFSLKQRFAPRVRGSFYRARNREGLRDGKLRACIGMRLHAMPVEEKRARGRRKIGMAGCTQPVTMRCRWRRLHTLVA
jgi:hypothetical protein